MLESAEQIYHLTIVNLCFDGNNTGKIGINLWLDHSIIDHAFIENFTGDGISIGDPQISSTDGYLNIIRYCQISAVTGNGIYVHYPCTDSWLIYNNIGSKNANIYTEGGPFRIIGNHLDGAPMYNYYNAGGQNIIFTDNICESAALHSIYMLHQSWDTFEEGWCISNNIIRNGGRNTNNNYDFIHLEGSAAASGSFVSISGNIFTHSSGNQTRYAIYVKFFANIVISNNSFDSGSYTENPVGLDIGADQIEIIGNTNNKDTLFKWRGAFN